MSKLLNKRVIFTVTTGRSGTHYLTRILRYLKDVDVYHEEAEHSFSKHLRAVQREPRKAEDFLRDYKIPFINECQASTYIETSHLFCKGFFESFLELGGVPDIIVLRRSKELVAKSLYDLGTIPGKDEKALVFYLSPDDPHVWKPDRMDELDDYERCYWYCLEIERRAIVYAQKIKELGGRVFEITLDDLKTIKGFRSLQSELDLRGPSPIGWLKFLNNRNQRAGNFDSVKKSDLGLDEMCYKRTSLDDEFDEFMRETGGVLNG